jgi:hypothetical protein
LRSELAAITLLAVAATASAGRQQAALHGPLSSGPQQVPTLEDRLSVTVPQFDAARRPMADVVLALAYEHQLPLALECVTRDALQKPLDLRARGQKLRELITTVTASVPGCRVDFSHGLVDVYSAEARTDSMDLFNTVIPEYRVAGVDTGVADTMLLCTLGRQMYPRSAGCGGSTAGDQWGHAKITLQMRNAKLYQILDAIVAQNGRAVWTPIGTSKISANVDRGYLTNFWNIYPLDPDFEQAVAMRLRALLAPATQPGRQEGDAAPSRLLRDKAQPPAGGSAHQPCAKCATTNPPTSRDK